MYVFTSVSFKLRRGTHAATEDDTFWRISVDAEKVCRSQRATDSHLPPDADTKVMKAFHGTLIVFGRAQPKPKLWPLECSLFLCDFSSVLT